MLLGIFLHAFGAYFEGFGLNFGAFDLQKMQHNLPNICCCRLGSPASKLQGAAVHAAGVFDKQACRRTVASLHWHPPANAMRTRAHIERHPARQPKQADHDPNKCAQLLFLVCLLFVLVMLHGI